MTSATASDSTSRRGLARVLGLLSLGLGAVQLVRPDELSRRIGLHDDETTVSVMRAVGLRELSVVPGLMLSRAPARWLWVRVAGDVVDLALLTRATEGRRGAARDRAASATGALAALTALDVLAARRAAARRELHLVAAITVNCAPERAYQHWHNFDRLPAFMEHLQSVESVGNGRSRWSARGPIGGTVTWDAQTTEDVPGQRIAWRSVGRTRVPNRGAVRFEPAPGGRGTEVRVHLTYTVPGGRAGAAVARLLGEDPHQQVEDDLRRFKQVLETGEVVRSDASPEGTAARRQLFQRPGRPVRSA